jgi:hypothetical protein
LDISLNVHYQLLKDEIGRNPGLQFHSPQKAKPAEVDEEMIRIFHNGNKTYPNPPLIPIFHAIINYGSSSSSPFLRAPPRNSAGVVKTCRLKTLHRIQKVPGWNALTTFLDLETNA